MKTTLQKVQDILASEFALPLESIKPEASLESLGIDSLGAIEALFKIEDVFEIRIPQGRTDGIKIGTVQDIVAVVERLVAEQQGHKLGDDSGLGPPP